MIRLIVVLAALLLYYPCKCQSTEYARRVIDILSSPDFKGRGYVQGGHRKAAGFIAGEFAKTGLQYILPGKSSHAKAGKDYLQAFPIRINTFPSKMNLKIDHISLDPGIDFLVHPASSSCKGSYELYIIEISKLAEPGVITRAIQESAGKFLMIDARNKASLSGDELKKANDLIDFVSFSSQIPSVGTLIITEEKLSWSIAKQQKARPVVIVNSKKIGTSPSEIDINLKSSLSWYKTSNVAGYIPGSICPDSFIFIIAHYDHLGMMGKKVYFPGANDNASGVAMLLSLAKYFKTNPHRYSVIFVSMAAEESGLDGSRFFAENCPVDLGKTVFLLNFDLAGTGDDGINVVNGTVYKDNFDRLVAINTRSELLKEVQIRGPACNSDHCSFHERGVPCFYIYTLGGSTAYHDIYDGSEALTLSEFQDYFRLMTEFIQIIGDVK